jgi:hypothetical protein
VSAFYFSFFVHDGWAVSHGFLACAVTIVGLLVEGISGCITTWDFWIAMAHWHVIFSLLFFSSSTSFLFFGKRGRLLVLFGGICYVIMLGLRDSLIGSHILAIIIHSLHIFPRSLALTSVTALAA